MRISLNGENRDIPDGLSLAALVTSLDLDGKRIAVELNGEIAARSRHHDTALKAGDRIEIVQAIGGG